MMVAFRITSAISADMKSDSRREETRLSIARSSHNYGI